MALLFQPQQPTRNVVLLRTALSAYGRRHMIAMHWCQCCVPQSGPTTGPGTHIHTTRTSRRQLAPSQANNSATAHAQHTRLGTLQHPPPCNSQPRHASLPPYAHAHALPITPRCTSAVQLPDAHSKPSTTEVQKPVFQALGQNCQGHKRTLPPPRSHLRNHTTLTPNHINAWDTTYHHHQQNSHTTRS
jgi:hypothetical protein